VDHQATRRGGAVFLIAPEPGLELTFKQLREGCLGLARFLHGRGLAREDKVSLLMPNGYQTARLFLGIMYAGLVAAPLNLQAQDAQLSYVLDHSDTRVVFTTAEHEDRLRRCLRGVPRTVEVLVIDHDAREILPRVPSVPTALPQVLPDAPALLLYTSGTTGQPKGALLTHGNLAAGGTNVCEAHQLTHRDRGLVSLPLYHINAEVVSVVAPLMAGGSIVMPHRFSTSEFWPLLSRYRCTWFSVVPTIMAYLVNATEIQGKGFRLDQVRFGRSASSALPPALHRAFEGKFGIGVVQTLGLTETAAPILSNPLDPSQRKPGSVGRAVGNQVRIADPDGGTCPPGVTGEILVKGPNVMKEYYKAPELTAQAFTPDGWLRTGDLGFEDDDGFVFVTGRIKELIIKGGENISPAEIDEALYKHPAVLEAAAVGIPDERYGEEIMVCVCLKDDCACGVDELRQHCLDHLGPYKTPKVIVFADELPKGPSGKIQRLKLRELAKD
jgi:long-chain acyl-CoA synthetase